MKAARHVHLFERTTTVVAPDKRAPCARMRRAVMRGLDASPAKAAYLKSP
jgi:hypothetical protein